MKQIAPRTGFMPLQNSSTPVVAFLSGNDSALQIVLVYCNNTAEVKSLLGLPSQLTLIDSALSPSNLQEEIVILVQLAVNQSALLRVNAQTAKVLSTVEITGNADCLVVGWRKMVAVCGVNDVWIVDTDQMVVVDHTAYTTPTYRFEPFAGSFATSDSSEDEAVLFVLGAYEMDPYGTRASYSLTSFQISLTN